MRGKLGEDESVVRAVKKHLKQAFKNKYFKKGYKSAAKGKSRSDNPYTLPPECWEILRKRTFWDYGWEQKAFSKTPKQIKEIERKNKEYKEAAEKRRRHEKRKREEQEEKHSHKHKHKTRHRHSDS